MPILKMSCGLLNTVKRFSHFQFLIWTLFSHNKRLCTSRRWRSPLFKHYLSSDVIDPWICRYSTAQYSQVLSGILLSFLSSKLIAICSHPEMSMLPKCCHFSLTFTRMHFSSTLAWCSLLFIHYYIITCQSCC